jgi:hypothetical protein
MGGDRKQLTPSVMTHGQKRNGRCVNMFSQQGKVSILEKM